VPQLDAAAVTKLGSKVAPKGGVKLFKPVGLISMIAEDVLQKCLQTVGWLLDVAMAMGKGIFSLLSAHTFLVALLGLSALYNSWHGHRDGMLWYQERSAGRFMSRVGVRPNPTIARAVYLTDIEGLVAAPSTNDTGDASLWVSSVDTEAARSCRSTFTDEVLTTSTTSLSTSSNRATDRLHRSRDALARYRHDLLVALRVVNRVERDVVDAEFEEYVRAEAHKCVRVEGMLARQKGSKADKSKGSESEQDMELGQDFAAYCDSCRHELANLASA